MDAYKDHPQCVNEGKLLPVSSNQKMNEYLKEIADRGEINKKMTFHTARHTFATTEWVKSCKLDAQESIHRKISAREAVATRSIDV